MEYFDLIDDCLNDRLPKDKRQAMEEALRKDPELRRSLNLHSSSSLVYDVLLEQSIQAEIEKHDPQITSPVITNIAESGGQRYRAWAIAASILVLIGLGIFLYANIVYSNQAIASTFVDLPNVSGVRGGGPEDRINEASLAFSQGNFERCISLLSGTDIPAPAFKASQHLLAYSYLMTKEPEKALSLFSEIAKTDIGKKPRAEYHQILSYIQSGDIESAYYGLELLINDTKHPFHKEAVQLKNKLDSPWRKLLI